MYPRVKVREQEVPVRKQKEHTSYIERVIESLSLESHYSSRIIVPNQGIGCLNESNPPHARISESRLKEPLAHIVIASEGYVLVAGKNDGVHEDNRTKSNGFHKDIRCHNDSHLLHTRISESHPKSPLTPSVDSKGKVNGSFDEDNKTNIRASSVPPPRAVLSSPDNDGIIGSQNERNGEKSAPFRRQDMKNDGTPREQNHPISERKSQTQRQISSSNSQTSKYPNHRSAGVENALCSRRKALKEAVNTRIIQEKKLSRSVNNKAEGTI